MIYLDNAATSFPKPEAVYQALDAFARQSLANPGRAGHKMALAAEHALDDCRHLLNQFFHGEGPERFVFTLNCTDALNMAFRACSPRATTSSPATWSTTASAGRSGPWNWRDESP
jgi:cysteine desulfurase / selenocysteine lyase